MELDDLIGRVRGDDALARLADAMAVKADLDDLADALVGHFVDAARQDGRSWSEIGAAMGVTKQAAQQRHTSERPLKRTSRMFARFTPEAKSAVERATELARESGHGEVGVVHIVLGVLAVRDSLGAVVLDSLGVDRATVLAATSNHVPARARRRPSMSRSAKKVIELALREALQLHRNHIGTEHLLLGAHREEPSALPGITRDALLDAVAAHEVAA